MWKPTKNPKIQEITESHKGRNYAISRLPFVTREDGTKGCIWCGDPLKSRHSATRYCKDPLCSDSVWAWANPQQDTGLFYLLQKQDWKCNICSYDYGSFIKESVIGKMYGTKSKNDLIQINPYIVKGLKRYIPTPQKPEVDHIIPIFRGGQSLGFSNHQIICKSCHKIKTKKDVSGKRKVLP